MSRVVATASALLVVAGTWSVAGQQPTTPVTPSFVVRDPTPKLLPGTRPNILTIIQGNALTSTNGPMPDTLVRLRDARYGRIVDTQITDSSGMFVFKVVDPGSYIVEMMGSDHTVLAASQILNVNAGEVVSAIVKLPFRIPPVAGVMGSSSRPSAIIVAAQAAASGIVAAIPTSPVSPNQ